MVSLSLSICLSVVFAALGADAPGAQERFRRSFGQRDFKVTRDAVKFEGPENGKYKIMPRGRNNMVWTQFSLPEGAWRNREWAVTANVNSSSGAGAGVGLWGDDGGYVFLLFPDGRGLMRYYEGRKVAWSTEAKVANFAWPARISLVRDVNGSIFGRVNDAIVGVRLIAVDLKKNVLPMVKSVSFSTQTLSQSDGGYALYDGLDVEAWGMSQLNGLFDNPNTQPAK